MNGFSILMLVFGLLIILAGLYIFTGHNSELLIWRGYNKNATKEEVRNIGKWTMISGLVPIILAIVGIFLNI